MSIIDTFRYFGYFGETQDLQGSKRTRWNKVALSKKTKTFFQGKFHLRVTISTRKLEINLNKKKTLALYLLLFGRRLGGVAVVDL
jgi:hypothetical protein